MSDIDELIKELNEEAGYTDSSQMRYLLNRAHNALRDMQAYSEKYLNVCRMLSDEQEHSKQLEQRIGNQRKEITRLQSQLGEARGELDMAKDRIADMLIGDDGQAWDEAETFMRLHPKTPTTPDDSEER